MKNKHTQLVVAPQCACHYAHAEAAVPGEAAVAVNLRQQEKSLVVTGHPSSIGFIPHGHRLLLVDGNDCFTCQARLVYCNGSPVAAVDHDIVAMHRVGQGIVVVTTGGLLHLVEDADGWHRAEVADAVPAISIVETDEITTQQACAGYTFAQPYDRWAAPLSAADVAAITSRYRTAWNTAMAAIKSQGGYSAPLMVCYGVRMWDDNYLWMSNPVTVGMSTMGNADAVSALAVTEGGKYVGIEAATCTLGGYHLGIKVNSGVGEQWLPLVKAIDVFATAQPAVADVSSLYYRCSTMQGGARVSSLQYGWQPLSQSRVEAALAAMGWTMVASTTRIDALAQGMFIADNVYHSPLTATGVVNAPMEQGATLTRTQAESVNTATRHLRPVASIVRNGRLYTASSNGVLAVTAHGNAMSTTQLAQVTGAPIRALAPVSRPIYSGGFGRYAVYMFTTEGIYAVAQSAMGSLGEARLVDRAVIMDGCRPVDGDRDVYFVDRHGWLNRLTGSVVTRLLPVDGGVGDMAWDDAHRELHVLTTTGMCIAVRPDGHYSRRTIDAVSLYDDITHAIACTGQGELLDLTREECGEMTVEYLSHPVPLCSVPSRLRWHVWSEGIAATLDLLGERGVSCHGFLVSRLRVNGAVNAPLPMPLIASPCRTVRLSLAGSAITGTVLSTTVIETEK